MVALTNEAIRRINAMDDAELARLTKHMNSEDAGGVSRLVPDNNIGTATSSISKQVGVNALAPGDGNAQSNHAYWGGSFPMFNMAEERRIAMLNKSLDDVGYRRTNNWSDFGSLLKDGWFNSKTQEFRAKHKESFEAVEPDFFKARGLTGTSGEQGGFLMLPELAPTVESIFIQNDIPSRIDTMTIGGNTFKFCKAKDTNRADGFRHGGIMHYWLDEGQTITESQPDLAFTKLEMKKLAIVVFMTNDIMNEHPAAIEQYVRTAVKEELAFAMGRAIFWGVGGKEPIGFGSSGSVISVPKEASQTTSTLITANVLKMESRMLNRPGADFVWLHHNSVIPEVGQLSIGNFPVSININNGGISQPAAQMLRGRPMINSEFTKMLGEAGDLWLCDLKMYKAIARSLVREDVSMHVEFLADKSCLRFIFAFDGAPLYDRPVTPYQAGVTAVTTVSSFINTAVRP